MIVVWCDTPVSYTERCDTLLVDVNRVCCYLLVTSCRLCFLISEAIVALYDSTVSMYTYCSVVRLGNCAHYLCCISQYWCVCSLGESFGI